MWHKTQRTENLFNEKNLLRRTLFLQPTRQRVYVVVKNFNLRFRTKYLTWRNRRLERGGNF